MNNSSPPASPAPDPVPVREHRHPVLSSQPPLSYNPPDNYHSGPEPRSPPGEQISKNPTPSSPQAWCYNESYPTQSPFQSALACETTHDHPSARSRPEQYHEVAPQASSPSSKEKKTSN